MGARHANGNETKGVNRMAGIEPTLRASLEAAFPGAIIHLDNESGQHAGHAGVNEAGDSHFFVRVIWPGFSAQSRLARHKAVNAAAKPAFEAGLHALRIQAKAPNEA